MHMNMCTRKHTREYMYMCVQTQRVSPDDVCEQTGTRMAQADACSGTVGCIRTCPSAQLEM